ncbi:MAG: hypothetical protein R2932_07010 [Caldilineaceae bacterium]
MTALQSQQRAAHNDNFDLRALVGHVNGALLWRLNKENEPSSTFRDRAAALLGYLVPLPEENSDTTTAATSVQGPTIDATLLAKTAYKPQPGNDIGNMNWAAVLAFLRVADLDQQTRFLAAIDPELAEMMKNWTEGNYGAISKRLNTPVQDRNIQGIAALALADIYNAALHSPAAEKILCVLIDAFYTFRTAMTLWSITHALATIDTITIADRVVKQYCAEVARRGLTAAAQWTHRKYFTYLIGLLRVHEPEIHQQLLENFNWAAARSNPVEITELLVETINAIGRLADPEDKHLLEQIVSGEFEKILPNMAGNDLNSRVTRARTKIQRAAVEALAYIGDVESVDALRKLREEITWKTLTTNGGKPRSTTEGPVTIFYRELNLAIDRTTDTIYWRLNWSPIGEVDTF